MKLFGVPITHKYIQDLTEFDMYFIDCSSALDDPKIYDKIKNTVYDEEFDEYANSTEDELTDEEREEMNKILGIKTESENPSSNEDFMPIQSETNPIESSDDWEEVD